MGVGRCLCSVNFTQAASLPGSWLPWHALDKLWYAACHTHAAVCCCSPQCGVKPAVLPPIWELLEKQPPDKRQPRVLQLPDVNSAALKRVLNQAATGE